MTEKNVEREFQFMGLNDQIMPQRFPCWLYKDGDSPITVENTDEEERARAEGYDNITASAMANKHLINWFWDLEDFSPKQLRIFAFEEYGVELPEEASQEKLFQAVIELTRAAPQHRNQLVLMAHTIKMNYDATLEEIKRLIAIPDGANVEYFQEEFTA